MMLTAHYFNPRSHKGSDAGRIGAIKLFQQFQPTLPQGERRKSVSDSIWVNNFNPRSRKGSDFRWCMMIVSLIIFQPTLPQGERPEQLKRFLLLCGISTHAPARGATGMCRYLPIQLSDFNPRSRKGSDAFQFPATKIRCVFQPTLPQGERQIDSAIRSNARLQFQPTLPQGERRFKIINGISGRYSNPRSRKGSDVDILLDIDYLIQFQPTLPQGERPIEPLTTCLSRLFQPTLPQGERRRRPVSL